MSTDETGGWQVADAEGVRVMAERCATCIFHPGNRMHLASGRVKRMLEAVAEADSCITCHSTFEDDVQAVCRGQYDALRTGPLQVAERLGLIRWWRP